MQRNHEQGRSRQDRLGGPWDAYDHAADGRCGPTGWVQTTPTMTNEPQRKRRPIRDFLRRLLARQMGGATVGGPGGSGTPGQRGSHFDQGYGSDGYYNAVLRFVDATLRWGFDARTREQDENLDRAGPLDVATMRDIGARREYQDYAPSARVPASGARRLHCIADSARCGLPR